MARRSTSETHLRTLDLYVYRVSMEIPSDSFAAAPTFPYYPIYDHESSSLVIFLC